MKGGLLWVDGLNMMGRDEEVKRDAEARRNGEKLERGWRRGEISAFVKRDERKKGRKKERKKERKKGGLCVCI
jgi:hypothetical protein